MSEDEDKDHEATQKKLDDARERGDIVQSAELLVAGAFAGLLVAAMMAGAKALEQFGTAEMTFLEQADRLSALRFRDVPLPISGLLWDAIRPLLPFFLIPGLIVLAMLLGMRGIVFAPEKLMPKLSRIDPFTNAGHKFGVEGLAQFAKGAAKMIMIGALVAVFIRSRLDRIMQTVSEPPGIGTGVLLALLKEFLILTVVITVVMGVGDYLWQRFRYLKRNRMSRQEVIDEFRQSEGDPHIKSQRRRRAEEIATNRMIADVPGADVVIVNPTHYAVALKWDRLSGRAPTCVAKGVDETAMRIREAAAIAGVPIHSDPPTARALHARIRIGEDISPDHYRAVAAAIRFAEAMRKRARSGVR